MKHVERCGALIHLIDATAEDVVTPYKTIRHELENYSDSLAKKPELVVLNKADAVLPEEMTDKVKALKKATKKEVFVISGVAHQGLTELLRALVPFVRK